MGILLFSFMAVVVLVIVFVVGFHSSWTSHQREEDTFSETFRGYGDVAHPIAAQVGSLEIVRTFNLKFFSINYGSEK